MEGFTNDIMMMRKQIKSLEHHILKYSTLENEQNEHELLEKVKETGKKASKMSTELQGLKVFL
jgi:coiled-coil domain-containing protein 77